MKQTNQEQNPFQSIASMLRLVYEETAQSNKLLEDIRDSLIKKSQTPSSTMMPLSIDMVQNMNLENRKISLLTSIDHSIRSIASKLSEMISSGHNKQMSTNTASDVVGHGIANRAINYVEDKFVESTQVDALTAGMDNIGVMLGKLITVVHTIKNLVGNIFAYLPNLASGNDGKAKQKVVVLGDLAKAVNLISKSLSDKMTKAWDSFVNTYLKFIRQGHAGKLTAITASLSTFAFTLRLLGIHLSSTKGLFWGLLISMTALSLLLISPVFMLGIGILIGAVYLFKKVLGDKEDNTVAMLIGNSSKVAWAILKLAAAFWIASKIPFSAVIKFGFMLLMLYGIIALFSRSKEGQGGGTKSVGGLFSLAAGLALLALVVAAYGEVNWSAAGMIVVFLIAIGASMYLAGAGGGTNLGTQILILSLALGVMILAVDAIKELDWKSTFMLISFLFILGAALAAAAYFNSKKAPTQGDSSSTTNIHAGIKMSGMFGFAFGIGLLVLALDAVSEVSWGPVIKMVVFIGAIIAAMALGNKYGGEGNIGEQFRALAMGMTAMIAVLALTGDINIEKVGYMLGYMMVTIGIMYLFKKFFQDHEEDKQRGLNIAEALTALIVAAVMIDKINNDTKQAAIFLFITASFAGILWLIGKHKDEIEDGIVTMLKSVGAIAAAFLLTYLINKVNTDTKQTAIFLFIIASFAGILGLIGKYKNKIEDGIVTMIKSVGAIAAALVLTYLINKAQLNYKDLTFFGLAIASYIGMLIGISKLSKSIERGASVLGKSTLVLLGLASVLLIVSLANISFLGFITFLAMSFMFSMFMQYVGANEKRLLRGARAIQAISISMALMIGVSMLINLLGASFSKTMGFALMMGALVGVHIFAGKFENQIRKGVKSMFIVAGVSLLFVGIAYLLGKIVVTEEYTYYSFVTMMLGLAAVMLIVGILDTQVKKGAISMMIVAGAALLFIAALHYISSITINYDNLKIFALAVVGMAAMTALLGYFAPLVIPGALAMLTITVSSLLFAHTLATISKLKINFEQIKNFGLGVTALALVYSNNAKAILKGFIPAGLMLGITIVTLVTSLVLALISLIRIKNERIVDYGVVMATLVNAYDSLGFISVTKAAAKAVIMLPILVSSLLAARAFKAIDKLEIRPSAIENFSVMIGVFVDTVSTAIKSSADKLVSIQPALESFGLMVSSAKGLADVVETFANMKMGVWKYDKSTGTMKLVDYKKIDDNMMKQVGIGIGKLIQSLLGPLAIISSDDEYWDFGGGVKVKNPFKRGSKLAQFFMGDNENGTNRVAALGNGYKALTEVMKNLDGLRVLNSDDPKRYETFKANFGSFLNILISGTNSLINGLPDFTQFKNKVQSIEVLRIWLERWGSPGIMHSLEAGSPLNMMMAKLSDSNVWDKITKNMKKTGEGVKYIVDNINKISIDKAMALERNLKLMAQAQTVEGIKECIIQLKQLIGMLEEQERRQEEYNRKQLDAIKQVTEAQEKLVETTNKQSMPFGGNSTVSVPLTPIGGSPKPTVQTSNQEQIKAEKKKLEDKLEELIALMNGRGINVKVVNLDSFGNKI